MPAALSRLAPTLHLLFCSLILAIGLLQVDVSTRGHGPHLSKSGAELSAALRTTLTTDAVIFSPAVALIDHHKPRAASPAPGTLPAIPEVTPPPPRYLVLAAPRAPPPSEGLPPGRPRARSPPQA
ncbi:hypothetical protein [Salipiger sp. PrR007]|uniref:hypothetical protein n=1 Tax=Salipiger sp. PrR007 TaxID=2706884 RepID=UPI0013BB8917|nr:hypothetical protein [Salipiger sp. PrR007]NDW33432.1 hypothetical protein [Salipiger sp. PrR007]